MTILFLLLLLLIFGKILIFALKATWGITKIFFSIFFLPLILISLVIGGMLYIAFPLLIVVGIISLFTTRA